MVAPSSTATSKSWLMPIDSSASIDGSTPSPTSSSRSCRRAVKYGRAASGSSRPAAAASARDLHSAAALGPPRGLASTPRARRRAWSARPPDRPGPAVAPAVRRRRALVQLRRADRPRRPSGSRRSSRRPSSPCSTAGGRSGASARARSAVSLIFWSASWTLFSPKSIWPAAAAARTWSAEKVLETATRRTEAGSRPARPAARAMRSRTPASRARGGIEHYFFSASTNCFAIGGVRARRRELEIRLELGDRVRRILADERHAEHVVRFGVIRVGLR